jgi:hypothetical protein
MNTNATKYKPINRLKFLNASALLKWLLAAQTTSRSESARQMAERASRELGFTVTIHNIQRLRWIIAHEITKPHP